MHKIPNHWLKHFLRFQTVTGSFCMSVNFHYFEFVFHPGLGQAKPQHSTDDCYTLLSLSLWHLSSSTRSAMIPLHRAAQASSQLVCILNCQLFTQVITVAVILCKYSRCKDLGHSKLSGLLSGNWYA